MATPRAHLLYYIIISNGFCIQWGEGGGKFTERGGIRVFTSDKRRKISGSFPHCSPPHDGIYIYHVWGL